VVSTLEEIERGLAETLAPEWDKRVYLASAVTLLDIIHAAPDAHERLLLVGHNPGLEDLVLMLVPDRVEEKLRDEVEEKFPTASVATLEFDVERWADVTEGRGHLSAFTRPRDLDPALGPDLD
jgi:phosphohistidine phosphatase